MKLAEVNTSASFVVPPMETPWELSLLAGFGCFYTDFLYGSVRSDTLSHPFAASGVPAGQTDSYYGPLNLGLVITKDMGQNSSSILFSNRNRMFIKVLTVRIIPGSGTGTF